MVGSKRLRSKTTTMAHSGMAEASLPPQGTAPASNFQHPPMAASAFQQLPGGFQQPLIAAHVIQPPPIAGIAAPLITEPSTGPAAGSSNLRGTTTEHGGTSHQGGLVTTTDLGPVLEQLQAFPLLPPRSTHAPAYTSNETLARVQLGSTHFSPPDPRSQAYLNLRVDQLAQRMDDQTSLMRQLLNQMNLVQNLGLGQPGEERKMDERTDRQLNDLRNNVRERLGPRLDIQARLGPQGSVLQRLGLQGGQQDNHRNEERRSAVRSQRSIHERLGPQGGQPDNPHNEDHEERRSTAHFRRDDSRRQATENLSQAQSTNKPPRPRRREGRPSQTNEEAAPPKRFSTPSFIHFKGDSDPESHLKHFKSVMILHKADDALMCKIFKNIDHLYDLRKKSDESLRDYIKRFKAEKANIVGCDDRIASSAFKKGLPAEHDLYRELTITPSQTLAEVYATAERYALWDDDRIAAKKSAKQENQPTKRAGQRSDGFSNKNKDKRRSHPQEDAAAGENYTKFTIPIHQILAQVKNKPWRIEDRDIAKEPPRRS
ncbi:unnamed protein product [Prunus brigantina]